jgi:hypothetical protein
LQVESVLGRKSLEAVSSQRKALSGKQVEMVGGFKRLCTIMDIELAIDVLKVCAHRINGDNQGVGHLRGRAT